MSVVIEQIFPLGRFHATPWNRNPFEDQKGEWPPSPWRLLRALAARWFQYQRETGDDDTNLRDDLLRALASELPSFRLSTQTWRGRDLRQYHPTQVKFTKKRDVPEVRLPQPTLTLDIYVAVPPGAPVYWIWPSCGLAGEAIQLLRQLLGRIHYFGRAEAWTTMRLVESEECIQPNCELRGSMSSTSVPVLAHRPDKPLNIELLLASTDDELISSYRIPRGTAWFHAVLPPRPRRSIPPCVRPYGPRIHVVRYALDSTVLPLVTDTLPVAEAARRALMCRYGKSTEVGGIRGSSEVLSGKDNLGHPLRGHRHAYYLPTDEDGDGRLDHLTVYAAAGFGHDERHAFDGLHWLRTGRDGEERHPLRLLLLGMGDHDEYGPGPLQTSRVWTSATPYIATHYAKTRGRARVDLGSAEARAAFLEADLRTQLACLRPDLASEGARSVIVEPLWDENRAFKIEARDGAACWRPIQFKRYRRKAGDDGGRRLAGAFLLKFPYHVRGPIALGYGAHFGMGLFVPAQD